ncbi:YkgJ family cysteine cluster protein [Chondrinema litorale]|uniref:YkgJ family cysteine cluster protein n=1 Tax=Chondrinema litorale TaxID=2994555 RepID=UPI002542C0D7|nr:YkgJ family cysteine cluster protein [Chondrinema litorale]UZR96376.1 YkgJ family cysteine cluster protein [Chondrinema litorale]
MSIVLKVKRIQKVFEKLESEVTQLQKNTGIYCLASCGQCCTKPNIEASVLEFLPLAFDLFLRKETTQYKEQILQSGFSICHLFNALSVVPNSNYITGKCSQYQYRALVCRLFGYASIRNKHGQKKLSTCKLIKGSYPEEVTRLDQPEKIELIPNYSNYFQQLVQIDFKLSQEFHPINKAILRAIDEVESYYNYRNFPYRYKKGA